MNFAPRAGIGWDVHGDGRLAIRSSYGLSYDYPTGEFMSNPAAAPPFGNRVRLTDPPGLFDDPYGHLPGGDPHPIVPGPNTEFPPSGRLRPSTRALTRRAFSRGTSRSSSSSGRTGRRRRATWGATPTGSGVSRP